jgi:hypothetical protein
MKPKEKAEQLVDKYLEVLPSRNSIMYIADVETAQKCAIIAVDELIECSISYDNYNATWASQENYWKEVKNEIEKL